MRKSPIPFPRAGRARHGGTRARRAEAGYALLMVVFLAAAMLVAAAVVAPNLLTQGIREREEEMIWRGGQYVRAVRLYYRKNGRFPQSIEDLAGKRGPIRFLRKAYRDPMNREDGSWRLIYVSPGGQLIGSVTRPGGLQFPASNPATPPGGQPAPASGSSARPQTPPQTQPQPSSQFQPAPLPSSTPGEGQVFGGNIIGVGSKVAQHSLKLYNGRNTYREWEFIWDPAKDAGLIVVPGQPPGGLGTTPPPAQPPPAPQPPVQPPRMP